MNLVFKLSSFLFLVLTTVNSNFNFYLSASETRRLLGFTSELFYVRNGTINQNALNFSVHLHSGITDILFTWYYLAPTTHFSQLNYSLSFQTYPLTVLKPTPNISHHGYVPKRLSVFRLSFQCTDQTLDEFSVAMLLKIHSSSSSSQNQHSSSQPPPSKSPLDLNLTNSPYQPHHPFPSTSLAITIIKECHHNQQPLFLAPSYTDSEIGSEWFYAGVGSVFGIIVITSTLLSTCYLRKSPVHYNKYSDVSILRSISCNDESFTRDGGRLNQIYPCDSPIFNTNHHQSTSLPQQQQKLLVHNHHHHSPSSHSISSSQHSSSHQNHIHNSNINSHQFIQHQNDDTFQSKQLTHLLPPHNIHHHSNPSSSSLAISPMELRCADARVCLQEVEIDASSVAFDKLISEGTYGRLFEGHLVGSSEVIRKEHANKKVLIKTLIGDAGKEATELFLREGCLTKDLNNKHILSLLAACVHDGTRPMLIYPRGGQKAVCRSSNVPGIDSGKIDDNNNNNNDNHGFDDHGIVNSQQHRRNLTNESVGGVNFDGDVKLYQSLCGGMQDVNVKMLLTSLRRGGGSDGDGVGNQSLSHAQLVMIGRQVSEGVNYLHKIHLVHKDLACRNCVINEGMVVKLTDSALSCDFFPEDYDRQDGSELRPIRWLSLEALQDNLCSPSSDAWSFGVLLWELMTYCQQPYHQVDTATKLLSLLQQGFRMQQPSSCPTQIFSIIACCWSLKPQQRPTFAQLTHSLQSIIKK